MNIFTERRVTVSLKQRAIVFRDGHPDEFLGPGVHRLARRFGETEVHIFEMKTPRVELTPDELRVIPDEEIRVLVVGESQRAAVRVHGTLRYWLHPGVHTIWNIKEIGVTKTGESKEVSAIEVEMFDVSAVDTKPLRTDLRYFVPSGEYREVTVPHGSAATRYVDGVFDRILEPGRYAVWTVERAVTFAVIDLRETELAVTSQEIITRDRVSVRVNVSAVYRVRDVKRAATVSREPDRALYLDTQLALRKAIATRTLDELLKNRESLAEALEPEIRARADALGLELRYVGVKDFVLPGAMKELMNRVIEARKRAEANVILRREEIAATRSMAQTAEVLEENPVLLRLKELEAYREIAEKVGNVDLFIGKEQLTRLSERD